MRLIFILPAIQALIAGREFIEVEAEVIDRDPPKEPPEPIVKPSTIKPRAHQGAREKARRMRRHGKG